MSIPRKLITGLVVVLPLLFIAPTVMNAEARDGYRYRSANQRYRTYYRPYYKGRYYQRPQRYYRNYSPYYQRYYQRYYRPGYYGTPRFHYHGYGYGGGSVHVGPWQFNWR